MTNPNFILKLRISDLNGEIRQDSLAKQNVIEQHFLELYDNSINRPQPLMSNEATEQVKGIIDKLRDTLHPDEKQQTSQNKEVPKNPRKPGNERS